MTHAVNGIVIEAGRTGAPGPIEHAVVRRVAGRTLVPAGPSARGAGSMACKARGAVIRIQHSGWTHTSPGAKHSVGQRITRRAHRRCAFT